MDKEAIDYPLHKNLQKESKPFHNKRRNNIVSVKHKCHKGNTTCYNCSDFARIKMLDDIKKRGKDSFKTNIREFNRPKKNKYKN